MAAAVGGAGSGGAGGAAGAGGARRRRSRTARERERERKSGERARERRRSVVHRRPAGREGGERSGVDGRTDGRRAVSWQDRRHRRGAGPEPPGTGWKEEAEKQGWRTTFRGRRRGGESGGCRSTSPPPAEPPPPPPRPAGTRGGRGAGRGMEAMRVPGWGFRTSESGESRVSLRHSHPQPPPTWHPRPARGNRHGTARHGGRCCR